jgi:single-strand DNA-binding protein
MNLVILRGILSSDPVKRELPSGSVLWTLEVTTRLPDESGVSVPVVCVDPRRPVTHREGDEVAVRGVVRRRFYRSGAGVQSRTEVVADRIASGRRVRDVTRLMNEASDDLLC